MRVAGCAGRRYCARVSWPDLGRFRYNLGRIRTQLDEIWPNSAHLRSNLAHAWSIRVNLGPILVTLAPNLAAFDATRARILHLRRIRPDFGHCGPELLKRQADIDQHWPTFGRTWPVSGRNGAKLGRVRGELGWIRPSFFRALVEIGPARGGRCANTTPTHFPRRTS